MAKSPYVHENLSDDDDEVLKDGEKRTVSMMMRDALVEYNERFPTNDAAKRFGLNDALALHKPGQRFVVDAAARARVEQARAEGIREMCDAWKNPPTGRGQQPGDQCTIDGQPGHLNHRLECLPDRSQDSAPCGPVYDAVEGQRVKDEAYRAMVNELTTAWQCKPVGVRR